MRDNGTVAYYLHANDSTKRDTGAAANGTWVDYENSTDQASGEGNISIASKGTYRITLDSFHKTVTIVKL